MVKAGNGHLHIQRKGLPTHRGLLFEISRSVQINGQDCYLHGVTPENLLCNARHTQQCNCR